MHLAWSAVTAGDDSSLTRRGDSAHEPESLPAASVEQWYGEFSVFVQPQSCQN